MDAGCAGQLGERPITRLDQSLRALEQIAQSSASIPGRKNLICKRAGLTLRTRDGYFVEETRQEKAAATISYDRSNAAESTVPLNGLRVVVERSTSVNAPPDSFVVHVGAANLTWKPADDGSSTASVAVMSVYLDREAR